MAKRVFVTGGTGFIGRAIVAQLRQRGDDVVVLSRSGARARSKFESPGAPSDSPGQLELVEGDPNHAGPWQESLRGASAVLHLAGQSVAGQRWDARYKQLIRDSRVEGTRFLVEGIAAIEPDQRPSVLVSASGIDYYPFAEELAAVRPVDEDAEVDENGPPGDSFLARVCRSWEVEAQAVEEHEVRVVFMRTGAVIGHGDDGPLAKMTTPFRFFVGGRIGSGRQWFSWIHLLDAARAYLFAADNDAVSGPVNMVAPETLRAGAFAKALGRAMGRPSWMPVPSFALKAAVGEFSEYLLHGRRTVPAALKQHGFDFRFPTLDAALGDLFGR